MIMDRINTPQLYSYINLYLKYALKPIKLYDNVTKIFRNYWIYGLFFIYKLIILAYKNIRINYLVFIT